MKRGADQRLCNHAGETPLDVAVEKKHADIVTLLGFPLSCFSPYLKIYVKF